MGERKESVRMRQGTQRNTKPAVRRKVAPPDHGPPWCIFADKGKSISVMPAGRPGDVCDVRFVPDDIVARHVRDANRWPAFASQIADELRALNDFHRSKTNAAGDAGT
jgi:hypothetical protein